MRRLAMGVIALTVVLGLASGVAAQPGCGGGDIPLGDVYLSFEANIYDRYVGTQNAPNGDPEDLQIAPFTPFAFYLVSNIDYCECGDCSLNFNKGFTAWEAQLDLAAAAGLTIISTTLSPAGSSNFGTPGNSNFLVGTGGNCVTGEQQPFAVVTFSALLQAAGENPENPLRKVNESRSPKYCNNPNGLLPEPRYEESNL